MNNIAGIALLAAAIVSFFVGAWIVGLVLLFLAGSAMDD